MRFFHQLLLKKKENLWKMRPNCCINAKQLINAAKIRPFRRWKEGMGSLFIVSLPKSLHVSFTSRISYTSSRSIYFTYQQFHDPLQFEFMIWIMSRFHKMNFRMSLFKHLCVRIMANTQNIFCWSGIDWNFN